VNTTSEIEARLDRMRRGDEKAADELAGIAYHRLRIAIGNLLGVSFPALQAGLDPTDVLHDVMLRLIPYIRDQLKVVPAGAGQFFELVATISYRTCLDRVQHFGCRPALPTGETVAPAATPDPRPSEERCLDLLAAKDRLPDQLQKLFGLMQQGFGTKEIAEMWGLDDPRVSELKAELRRQMRELLGDKYGF
jgi:DNA-directed RNA polymerase specialized sigma24 family protein